MKILDEKIDVKLNFWQIVSLQASIRYFIKFKHSCLKRSKTFTFSALRSQLKEYEEILHILELAKSEY